MWSSILQLETKQGSFSRTVLPRVRVETGAAQQLRLVLPEHVVVCELQVSVRVCLRVRLRVRLCVRVGVALGTVVVERRSCEEVRSELRRGGDLRRGRDVLRRLLRELRGRNHQLSRPHRLLDYSGFQRLHLRYCLNA